MAKKAPQKLKSKGTILYKYVINSESAFVKLSAFVNIAFPQKGVPNPTNKSLER